MISFMQRGPGLQGDFGHANVHMVFQSNTASRIQNDIVCDLISWDTV